MQALEEKLAAEGRLREAADDQTVKLQAEVSLLLGKLAQSKELGEAVLRAEQQKVAESREALAGARTKLDAHRDEAGAVAGPEG